jgi:DNA repair protein RecO (recombination protein O)
MLVETDSIILKTYNLAEADKIVVFLTEEHGIVRGVAKGAKRLKSRFGSGVEPFTVVRLTYKQKENIELVGIEKTELISSYFASAGEPNFLETFSQLGELLITFSPPHDPSPNLYRMFRACLKAASADPGSLPALSVYAEIWLLRLAGYLPVWERCDRCKRAFNDSDLATVSSNFYLHCSNCVRHMGDMSVEVGHRVLFSAALNQPPAEFASISASNSARLFDLSQILRRMITGAAGKEISQFGMRAQPK